ncbi:MAG TPA: deoxyuridine 5'-triphosphate nucleotidohydrolase [Vicinamibacteria bacterium]|nr:deoxyuridine 5'-triphosphate nucleotidohydrolase [Vicinamibacteria bacterium]
MAAEPPRPPGALPAAEIRALLLADPPLASGLADADLQVQPNGLDVRLESVWLPESAGLMGAAERAIPERRELAFDGDGWLHLPPGGYVVRLCETVNLPPDLLALGFARSSLLRSGCGILNAVWDAGYHGRSEALLAVMNPHGFRVQRGARIAQLVFFRLPSATAPYRGAYHRENLDS